jgi:hypothetical protein
VIIANLLRREYHASVSPLQIPIILRGANDYMLDEIDRSLHDALCIVKRTLESNMVSLLLCLFLCCAPEAIHEHIIFSSPSSVFS